MTYILIIPRLSSGGSCADGIDPHWGIMLDRSGDSVLIYLVTLTLKIPYLISPNGFEGMCEKRLDTACDSLQMVDFFYNDVKHVWI